MKHASKICKNCGSRNPETAFERELLEDGDYKKIRICGVCKSEYFHIEPPGIENASDADKAVNEAFLQTSNALGLSEEQALVIAKQLFIRNLKI